MITNEKKNASKNTKNCRKMPNTTTFDFSDQNFKFKSQIDLKLTILVVL